MCGIAGYVGWPRPRAEANAILGRMCAAIRHRGPNDEGHFVADGVGLGMRRLSVIDVAGGAQPIANEDRTTWIVFNGEIYNHRELRAQLATNGHRLATRSDTECIVHRYEDVGDDVVKDLRGMFAFALWDDARQRLLLARDRLGIKPLYYWERDGGLAFASELRSMLTLPEFSRILDPTAIGLFLSLGYVPEPLSVFAGVRKLLPGHRLTWSRERGVTVEPYWSVAAVREQPIDEREAIDEFKRLLAECVRYHLEADVPLGAFLSGGIDSSTIVAQMARLVDQPVRTFSIGFNEPEFNEAPYAARVARALGTEHTELIVRPDADALVEEVVRCYDEPFSDPSALPTYLVSRLARQHVTVALSGDGGDELFLGYTRYLETLGHHQLGAGVRRGLDMVARRLPFATPWRNRLLDLARTRRGRYAATVASPLATDEGGIARPEVAARVPALDALLDASFRPVADRDFASQLGIVDLQTYLPGDILTKVDRASMAVSLEARVPFLDHRMVEFALSLPSALKVRDGSAKWLVRQAIRELVPPGVLDRPKQGFALPIATWFRRELSHRVDHLLVPNARVHEFTDVRAVRRLAVEHRVGRRDHSWLLWRVMVLDLWLDCLAEGAIAKPSPGLDAVLAPTIERAVAS
jgi:asparagine synthase (glutamine-hydrolysing)